MLIESTQAEADSAHSVSLKFRSGEAVGRLRENGGQAMNNEERGGCLRRRERLICDHAPLRAATGLAVAALISWLPAGSHAQTPPNPLKMAGAERLTLDPVCNARGGVGLDALLRNDGLTAVPLALSVGEPVNRTAGRVAVTTVTVTELDDRGQKATGQSSLAPAGLLRLRVGLIGTLDSGEWEIELRNGGARVGALTVVSPQVGYGVKPDTATPDRPELTFVRNKPATIALKNEDGFGYRVSGQFSARGIVQDAMQELYLPPNGGGELRINPPNGWFSAGLRTLFKDDVTDGRLTLRFSSDACDRDSAAPARMFKVKTTLDPWSADRKDGYANFVLMLTLVLGGVCSLALNFFLPGNARRMRARTQLSLTARRVDDIPIETDSRVRNSLAVEQRQLKERLLRVKFDGQFNSEMTEIERGLARLGTRLDLLGKMQLVLSRYWQQRSVIVSDEIEALRDRLMTLLRQSDPGDSDIDKVQSLINEIDARLGSASAINSGLASSLAARISVLKEKFDIAPDPIAASAIWKDHCAELRDEWNTVHAASSKAADIAPGEYVRLARAVFILEQICTFVRLCKGELTQGNEGLLKLLMGHLRARSWDRLKRAERLVGQMGEGIFYEQVDNEIKEGGVNIEPSRPVVRQFEPTDLRIIFSNKDVHNSIARREYTCNWEIEHAKLKVKLPSGSWSLSYLFPFATAPELQPPEPVDGLLRRVLKRILPRKRLAAEAGNESTEASEAFKVSVTFIRDDGKTAGRVVSPSIDVRPPLNVKIRASAWNEFLQLFLALGIATIGLVAGAREQILKLDVFPALIAVFLLGFGSDRIKNIFTQSAPATPESKPSKTDEQAQKAAAK